MIPDLSYTDRNLYISNQVNFRPMYLLGLDLISLPTERLLSFNQYPDFYS